MSLKHGWLARIMPSFSQDIEHGGDLEKEYRFFSRSLFAIILVLVLTPLMIISMLSHYQYRQLLQKKELAQIVLNVEQGESTIERFVSKLQSIIKFVGRDDRYQELLDPQALETLFSRLQREYPDFVDLEIIDARGISRSYVGPYQLKGREYGDQTWYRQVLLKGVYISTVFSGFRRVPHFVIAVSRRHPRQPGSWVLRVTIDGNTLQRYVDTIRTSSVDDIFLVDGDQKVLTRPQKYGLVGQHSAFAEAVESTSYDLSSIVAEHEVLLQQHIAITVKKIQGGERILHVAVDLKETPWRLVMVKELYMHGEAWFYFQLRLFSILFCCVVVAIFIILRLSNGITSYIRESDRKRQLFLAEAEHANKLASIGRLAAGVAHEINNPLSIINQKTGLVLDYFEMSGVFDHKEAMEEALDGIQKSVNRCKTITHRLLGFARHTEVESEEIDLNLLLEEVVAFLAKEATYNQICIDYALDQELERIVSDRGQLQQVLLNIVNNAIDAIGSNGRIILGSRQKDRGQVVVTIADNGGGMSREVQQRIFDPFFTTKETGKGTGLGLSITYGIVEKLGGTIRVESEVGAGTCFEITLPVGRGQAG
ncbi:sensor histidine kinase [Desulfogranum mediterraneum]|uniref:sensor histidine kinase n=1 Tax=Desulfogranum mediterraneum TaxID=160661 RepID=UPI000427C30E|nr:PAS domain-containing sensor histidine kinase [Desulfogranum mediterraneum]